MVDDETAEAGLEALGVAIAILLEDAHEASVTPLPTNRAERSARIAALRTVGEDVAVLAEAMEVLDRRLEVHES